MDSLCRVAEVVRPAAGGIRRHVFDLLEHLDRRKFVPTLFAPEDFLPDRPLTDIVRHSIEIGTSTRPLPDYKAGCSLAQLLPGNVDLVHAHGLRAAVVGGFAARKAHLPYLFTVHNLLPHMNRLQATVFLELARKADRIIAVSEAVAQTVQQIGVRAQRIAVVPNGVDLSRFDHYTNPAQFRTEHGIDADERIVLAVGRLAPEKGFDVLIEAFSSLRERLSDVRLVIVGEGLEGPRLKLQAAPLGASVLFLGQIGDTAPLFEASDLVVAPSRQEGQGIVPLEAMAAGKPVVASRVGGLVETIVEGKTGLLVPVDDAPALAVALESLLNDSPQRVSLGAAGRRRVEQEYSLQAQIQKIEANYRDVFRRTA